MKQYCENCNKETAHKKTSINGDMRIICNVCSNTISFITFDDFVSVKNIEVEQVGVIKKPL